jgi:hypothetical protein
MACGKWKSFISVFFEIKVDAGNPQPIMRALPVDPSAGRTARPELFEKIFRSGIDGKFYVDV